MLASPAFRNSKQCQKFLTYVVEHSLTHEEDRLKERTIGSEVFGREADYDTAGDPVVRVRATEVRKRVAQYYSQSGLPEDARIEMPSGAYHVEFHFADPPKTEVPVATISKRRLRWPWLLAGCLLVVALAGWMLRRPAPATALDRFWAPILESSKPVLLYCGQPVVYFLSREVHEKYRATRREEDQRGSYVVQLEPEATIRGRDIVPVTDQFVGIGNAHTASRLSALFALKGKPVEIRYANDISFSDLRSSPAVLIGAFSNLWTLEMTGKLRLVFEQQDGSRRIRDRSGDRTWQLPSLKPDGKTPEDYAIVTRIFDSAAGQVLISAAGITQYGTRAAGEFLTDEGRLDQAMSGIASDWPSKNVQVLLQTTIYKGTPGPPRVLVTHVW
jgi:hypothetical protein